MTDRQLPLPDLAADQILDPILRPPRGRALEPQIVNMIGATEATRHTVVQLTARITAAGVVLSGHVVTIGDKPAHLGRDVPCVFAPLRLADLLVGQVVTDDAGRQFVIRDVERSTVREVKPDDEKTRDQEGE